jgi:hypothetical protein
MDKGTQRAKKVLKRFKNLSKKGCARQTCA